MVEITSGKCTFCDSFTRRDFLRVGGLGVFGLTLGDLFRFQKEGIAATKKDMACIFLFLVGGPSQHDTWDPKPDAPKEIRSPFQPISTNVPGIQISECFPKMAQKADKYAIIRSLYHTASVHEQAHQLMQTGRMFGGDASRWPAYGSVVASLKSEKNLLSPYVVLPRPIGNTGLDLPHGEGAEWLGKANEPLFATGDPNDPQFKLKDVSPQEQMGTTRIEVRRTLKESIDRGFARLEDDEGLKSLDASYQRAYRLMLSEDARRAFDLSKEPETLRDAYGRNTFGQSFLLSRRLVEAGVRFVTVNMFDTVFAKVGWDTHGGGQFPSTSVIKTTTGPMFDAAYSSLLTDLQERSMLQSTLVVAMGEFGRTPQHNGSGGRDHWPGVWSIILAGGGVQGGQVIGASDPTGSYPKDRPVTPMEFGATIYHSLGIDTETFVKGLQGRPTRIIEADPVRELFS